MVMSRDARMQRTLGDREYADPIHRPISRQPASMTPAETSLSDLALLLNLMLDKLDNLKPSGSGGGSGPLIVPTSQLVHFETIGLSTAHTDAELKTVGGYNYCIAWSDGNLEGCSIKLKDQSSNSIDLGRFPGFPLPSETTNLFITNDVRAGRTSLILGFSTGEPLRLSSQRQIVTGTVYNAAITTIGSFQSTWFNYSSGRLLIDVVSTLDQDCSIQLVGNIEASYNTAKDIGVPLNCPAAGALPGGLDIGLAEDDWHPYIGVTITTAVAPTTGTLTIKVLQLSEGR